MLRPLSLIALALTLLVSALGAQQRDPKRQASAQPPSAPGNRYSTTLLQNADITIRRLNIPVGAEAPIAASTHDYLLISIGNNSISARGEGDSFDLAMRPGDMQVLQGGWQHSLVNTAASESELFMIEPARNIDPKAAICGLGAKSCREHDFGETPQGTYNQMLQFETETTKLYRLSIGAGVKTHLHADARKHLIVALTPFQGHQDTETFTLKAGDMRWIPSGFNELGNDGAHEVRLLVLELK